MIYLSLSRQPDFISQIGEIRRQRQPKNLLSPESEYDIIVTESDDKLFVNDHDEWSVKDFL